MTKEELERMYRQIVAQEIQEMHREKELRYTRFVLVMTIAAFLFLFFVLVRACPAQESQAAPWLPDAEQARLKRLWPKDLDMPPELKFYKRTTMTQHLDILVSGRRETERNLAMPLDRDLFGGTNPNQLFPWAVSGGMDGLKGWKSHVAVALPEVRRIKAYWQRVEAGAGRPLEMAKWEFPVNTVFIDMLTHGDKVFEVRKRIKVWNIDESEPKWFYGTEYRDMDAAPAGYKGPGFRCIECHKHAGGRQRVDHLLRPKAGVYGPRTKGSDQTFSFPMLLELPAREDTAFDPALFDQGLAEGK